MRIPDLTAEIVPGVGAAGFLLGEDLAKIKDQIGQWDFCDSATQIGPLLLVNEGWLLKESRLSDGQISTSLFFKNSVVALSFGSGEKLYQIAVGVGYARDFCGTAIGDDIRALEARFKVEFDDSEDAFFISDGDSEVSGIAFVTDYRASLEAAPCQVIQKIVISDYAILKS